MKTTLIQVIQVLLDKYSFHIKYYQNMNRFNTSNSNVTYTVEITNCKHEQNLHKGISVMNNKIMAYSLDQTGTAFWAN